MMANEHSRHPSGERAWGCAHACCVNSRINGAMASENTSLAPSFLECSRRDKGRGKKAKEQLLKSVSMGARL